MDVKQVCNDPVLNALLHSPDFRIVLEDRGGSLRGILRKRILEMYTVYQSSVDQGSVVKEPSSVPYSEPAFEPEHENGIVPMSRKILYRNSLHRMDLDGYTGSTVIIASYMKNTLAEKISADLEKAGFICRCVFGDELPAIETLESVSGFIFVADPIENLMSVDTAETFEAIVGRMGLILRYSQLLYDVMSDRSYNKTFFSCVTFGGMSETGDADPFMGALHSQLNILPLYYKKNTIVKSVDFGSPEEFETEVFLKEVLTDDDLFSVGYTEGKRFSYEWTEGVNPGMGSTDEFVPEKNSVILAIGGGRGITAESVVSIAQETPCHFVLTGRTDIFNDPQTEPFSKGHDGKPELKKRIIKFFEQSGQEITPSLLESIAEKVIKCREVIHTIELIRNTGSEVVYVACDVTDEMSVHALLKSMKVRFGRLDAVLYGAGIDKSKSLLQKDMESFREVLRPKIQGVLNLLSNLHEFPGIRRLVLFSSLYAWRGMLGSMDYTAGNRFMGECESLSVPECPELRISSIYWAPWAGSGMAATEYLRDYFNSFGIEMLTVEQGAEICRAVLKSGAVSTAAFSLNSQYGENNSAGFIVTDHLLGVNSFLHQHKQDFPLIERVLDFRHNEYVRCVRKFTLQKDLYLRDHVFDDEPIMPGVFGNEFMAETARFLFPELFLTEAEDVKFITPFRFREEDELYVVAEAKVIEQVNGSVTIRSTLSLLNTDEQGKFISEDKLKFSGVYILREQHSVPNNVQLEIAAPVQGVNVTVPIDFCHKICDDNKYNFGPRMAGTVQDIHLSLKSCETDNSYILDLFRTSTEKVCLSTNPLAIDISIQGLLKSAKYQYNFRVIPTGCRINWFPPSENMTEFHAVTELVSVNMERNEAVLLGSIYNESGELAISIKADVYIRNRIAFSETLRNLIGGTDGYGFLETRYPGTTLSLCAVSGNVGMEQVALPQSWGSEPGCEGAEGLNQDWAASRLALQRVCRKLNDESEYDIDENMLQKESGKYRMDPDGVRSSIDFSVSHSDGWGFAGAATESVRIGVDIEKIEPRHWRFSSQFLNEEEKELIRNSSPEFTLSEEELLTVIFSCKEAVMKAFELLIEMKEICLIAIESSGTAVFEIRSSLETNRYVESGFYLIDKKVLSVCRLAN